MAVKSIFQEIESRFSDVPIARGKNVFLAADYAKEAGIGGSTARERLLRLAGEGVVRQVRTPHNGRITRAWEYLGKRGSGE